MMMTLAGSTEQIEMNTIAAGGAGLASANPKLHRYCSHFNHFKQTLAAIGAYGT
jgi:hypothetical protein